jgi:hypothetical protein
MTALSIFAIPFGLKQLNTYVHSGGNGKLLLGRLLGS